MPEGYARLGTYREKSWGSESGTISGLQMLSYKAHQLGVAKKEKIMERYAEAKCLMICLD